MRSATFNDMCIEKRIKYLLRVGVAPAGADLRGANFKGMCLCFMNFNGADLTDADFTHTNLKGAWFGACKLGGTCLDPANVLNGGAGEWEDAGDGYVYGYRPHKQLWLMGMPGSIGRVGPAGPDYEEGKHYEAHVFSIADTAGHPGLRVFPNSDQYGGDELRVRLKKADLHSIHIAWGHDPDQAKYVEHRCKAFDVLTAVAADACTTKIVQE